MTATFILAVGSSFAIKANKKFLFNGTVNIGSASSPFCLGVDHTEPCRKTNTGPQCTTYAGGGGVLRPLFEYPIPAGPVCVTPLREYQP